MYMENNDSYDLELAKYIWSIIKTQIAIFMSWGVNPESVKAIGEGLNLNVTDSSILVRFRLFLMKGKICSKYT